MTQVTDGSPFSPILRWWLPKHQRVVSKVGHPSAVDLQAIYLDDFEPLRFYLHEVPYRWYHRLRAKVGLWNPPSLAPQMPVPVSTGVFHGDSPFDVPSPYKFFPRRFVFDDSRTTSVPLEIGTTAMLKEISHGGRIGGDLDALRGEVTAGAGLQGTVDKKYQLAAVEDPTFELVLLRPDFGEQSLLDPLVACLVEDGVLPEDSDIQRESVETAFRSMYRFDSDLSDDSVSFEVAGRNSWSLEADESVVLDVRFSFQQEGDYVFALGAVSDGELVTFAEPEAYSVLADGVVI